MKNLRGSRVHRQCLCRSASFQGRIPSHCRSARQGHRAGCRCQGRVGLCI